MCVCVWRVYGVCRRWVYGAMACVGVCGYRAMACVGVGVRCVWRWVYVWLACVYALGVCRVAYVVYIDTLTW